MRDGEGVTHAALRLLCLLRRADAGAQHGRECMRGSRQAPARTHADACTHAIPLSAWRRFDQQTSMEERRHTLEALLQVGGH